ncbi:MAG: hypothetical protein HUU34_22605 [Saprospiraceae bacterium]|nr:hypothetical protein [Saprospiraceae bacterium]
MFNTNNTNDWDELAQSVADGEAVLVLGPDAIPIYRIGTASENAHDEPAEATFSQLAQRRICAALGTGVTYFYERDNLFLFLDPDVKNQAQKVVKRCANDDQWLPDAELLRQIAAMKFPVILSLSPDGYVRDTFSRYGLNYQFDYFTAKDKTTEITLATPKPSQPLLYNLCGYALEDDYDSVILDYHDLYGLLTALLGDLNVPDVLRGKLKKANRFILLGFHLERWYAQLLLHYINKVDGEFDNSNHNFAMLTEISDDAREFVIEQFQMKCIAPSREEFNQLFESCRRLGALRQLSDPLAGPAAEIRLLVEKNDLAGALEILDKNAGALEDSTIPPMLKSQYNEWLKHFTEKTEDSRELELMKNKLRSRILTFAGSLPS